MTRVGLPSLAVTIGTLTLYRGIAQIILPNSSLGGFPASLTNIGVVPIPHTQVPYSIAIFAFLAVVFAIVLHATPVGRAIFAIGSNQEAAYFSGIRVKRIKLTLFVVSGLFCAIGGILFSLRFASARYDAGTGLELNAVLIVLLGGISIFGGRGTILGLVLAVCVIATLQDALTLDLMSPQDQNVVIGALLVDQRDRARTHRPSTGARARASRARPRGARAGGCPRRGAVRRDDGRRSARAPAGRALRHRPRDLLAAVRGPARAPRRATSATSRSASRELGAEVVSAGLVDTAEGAREAGDRFAAGRVDLVHAATP